MQCALCRKDKELVRSHIIPEFIYEPLYDEKHRFHVLSTHPIRPRPFAQKGIREKLLCRTCEQHLSKYETYARKVLFGGVEITGNETTDGIVLEGINYDNFKLFQLSILWRASTSKDRMFCNVDLGPHEETIRNMIKSGNPGAPYEYACIMVGIRSKGDAADGLIYQPVKMRMFGHRIYRFIFGGLVWIYFVSSHSLPEFIKNAVLNEDETVYIPIAKLENLACLRNFLSDLNKMRRLPDNPS